MLMSQRLVRLLWPLLVLPALVSCSSKPPRYVSLPPPVLSCEPDPDIPMTDDPDDLEVRVNLDLAAKPYARPAEVRIMLSGNPCTVRSCGYLAGDGYVCPTCVEAWEVELGNVAVLVEDLGLSEINHVAREMRVPVDKHDRLLFADPRRVAAADDQTVGPGVVEFQKWASSVAPGNRAASYWLGRLRNELVGQIRFICETGHIKVPALGADTVAMSRWLLRQSGRLSKLAEGSLPTPKRVFHFASASS